MAVARAVSTDLVVVNFTIGASSFPTTTQVSKVITSLYIDAFTVAYGGGYAVYDAAAEDPIVDTEECKNIIISEAQEIVQAWHMSNPEIPPPSMYLSRDAGKKIRSMLKRRSTRVSNIRVMGNEWDDY